MALRIAAHVSACGCHASLMAHQAFLRVSSSLLSNKLAAAARPVFFSVEPSCMVTAMDPLKSVYNVPHAERPGTLYEASMFSSGSERAWSLILRECLTINSFSAVSLSNSRKASATSSGQASRKSDAGWAACDSCAAISATLAEVFLATASVPSTDAMQFAKVPTFLSKVEAAHLSCVILASLSRTFSFFTVSSEISRAPGRRFARGSPSVFISSTMPIAELRSASSSLDVSDGYSSERSHAGPTIWAGEVVLATAIVSVVRAGHAALNGR
mmetsp:Transcript_5105/g.12498  ORF Transcript_5105/g.12498 Transcript_5105/m.12498 type:complete len:271 (+) Transcript_5105:1581-2393(+)